MPASSTSCLCGAVKITANEINAKFSACHCEDCRRWGGGPYFGLTCGSDVQIEGEGNISIYDSSEWACRGFCSQCGTHLFYRLKHNGEYHIPAGLFPDLKDVEMELQYFTDVRPEYYCLSNQTRELTRAEVFELFAQESD